MSPGHVNPMPGREGAVCGGREERRSGLAFGSGLVTWLGVLAMAGAARAWPTPRVEAIRAQPFEPASGALTADVLAPGAPGLWNAIAGPHALDAALITVRAAVAQDARPRLRLRATEPGGQVLLDETVRLARPGPDGRVQAAFLIRPSGCRTVTLTASLVGRPCREAVRELLSYACGE